MERATAKMVAVTKKQFLFRVISLGYFRFKANLFGYSISCVIHAAS